MKLSILVLALSLAGGGDAPKSKTDQEQLQGTWTMTSLHVGDRDLVASDGYESLTFEGDKMFITRNGQRFDKGTTFKLDPTKSPRTIDLEIDGAPKDEAEPKDDEKIVYQGIYEFDGPRLRICFHQKKRPTKFESEKQMGEPFNVLYKLERKIKDIGAAQAL